MIKKNPTTIDSGKCAQLAHSRNFRKRKNFQLPRVWWKIIFFSCSVAFCRACYDFNVSYHLKGNEEASGDRKKERKTKYIKLSRLSTSFKLLQVSEKNIEYSEFLLYVICEKLSLPAVALLITLSSSSTSCWHRIYVLPPVQKNE